MAESQAPRQTMAAAGARSPWPRRAALVAAGAALLLAAAWLLRADGPRELPHPTLEPRAPFPELATAGDAKPGGEGSGTGGSEPPSRFEAALRRAGSPPPAAEAEAPAPQEPEPGLTFPLGGGLVADLPGLAASSSGSWRWAGRGWAGLAVHLSPAGRPDALVYAEPFSPLWLERPSAELLRFHVTVLPASVAELPLAGSLWRAVRSTGSETSRPKDAAGAAGLAERARHRQLDRTATRGRGIGFEPGEEGPTGTRWVGRSREGAMLRLRRFDGAWRSQGTSGAGSAAVAAYLLTGSATSPEGLFGAHLALLCSRAPECPVAEDLASFLASVRVGAPDRIERLRQGALDSLEGLAARTGLELEDPRPPDSVSPTAGSPPTAPTP